MAQSLSVQLKAVLKPQLCFDKITYKNFKKRINEGNLTRDENPASHFCTFFLPYCQKTKKVFLIHHRKSNLWLSPGGHIDEGESLHQTTSREIKEELDLEVNSFSPPFMFSIVKTENLSYSCRIHYDVWFLIKPDNENIKIDNREFLEVRWLDINEAEEITNDPATLGALRKLRDKSINPRQNLVD